MTEHRMTNRELIDAFWRSFEIDDEHKITDEALELLGEIERRLCPEATPKPQREEKT